MLWNKYSGNIIAIVSSLFFAKLLAITKHAVATFILRLPHSKVGYIGEVPLSHHMHYDSISAQFNSN